MRTVLFVAILFILVLIIIFANASYIRQVSDLLVMKADSLPSAESDDCLKETELLYEKWIKEKNTLKLSVDSLKIEEIEAHLISMKVWARHKNPAEFEAECELFKEDVSDMTNFESFSIFAP